ncbi:Hypothetical predicted protein [Mytilus galloprovincialis]|uniref:Uncharacterized protein n=1 Tax=Mytilus galloprovincialis TaxID=29158 RepID=A0A8B6F9G6_MYTGA|nr:Hypothetical predicted protein [Mytilus galloprovincialis]
MKRRVLKINTPKIQSVTVRIIWMKQMAMMIMRGNFAEDTPVEQKEQSQEPDTSPVPVRRSGRDRRPQAWMSSGLYDIAAIGTTSVGHTTTTEHSKPTAEWQQKAEYILISAIIPLFSGLQREAALAILDIVNHH